MLITKASIGLSTLQLTLYIHLSLTLTYAHSPLGKAGSNRVRLKSKIQNPLEKIITACKLKVFGEDAYGKVTAQCKVGSSIINYLLEKNRVCWRKIVFVGEKSCLLEKNRVFFPVTAGCQHVPMRV